MKQKHSQGLRDVYCYHEIKESEDIPKEKKKSFEQEFKHIFDPTSRSPLLWAIGSAISLYSTVFSNVKFHRPFNKS